MSIHSEMRTLYDKNIQPEKHLSSERRRYIYRENRFLWDLKTGFSPGIDYSVLASSITFKTGFWYMSI